MKELIPELRFPEFEGEWEEKRLEEILTVQSGKDYKHLKEGNIPVFGSGGLMLFVDDFLYDGKSVCIGRKGTIDKPMFVKGKFWTVDTLFYTNNFEGCIPEYIYQQFLNINWKRYNEAGGVPSLSKKIINNIVVSIPNISEQTKIANFLSVVDEQISLLTEKQEKLQTYKRGVMQKLFSQELRFKDEHGEDYPEWEEKKLGEVSDVRDGTHDSPQYVAESNYYLITSKNLKSNGSIDFNNISYLKETDFIKINRRSKVEYGDVLFGMIGTIGNPVVVELKEINFAIKNVALIKKSSYLNSGFLYNYIKSDFIESQFHRVNTGNTQKFISLSLIRNLNISVPVLPEQTKIADFLTAIDGQLEEVEAQIAQTKLFKQGLLQKMFV